MSWFSDLISRLDTETGITRIYSGSAPESAAKPYIVLSRIASQHVHHLNGASGLTEQTVQIDVYADKWVTAHNTADSIREGLDGFTGTMGSTDVRRCFLDTERDDFFQPTDSSQQGVFRISSDYTLAIVETVPTF